MQSGKRDTAECPPRVGQLLTVDDVAAELQIPRSTAYLYMREMVRVVAGRHVRVSRQALDAWIAARTVEPPMPRLPVVVSRVHVSGGARRTDDIYVTQPRRKRAR